MRLQYILTIKLTEMMVDICKAKHNYSIILAILITSRSLMELSMRKRVNIHKHTLGAALVEYALLVALIAVVCVTAMQTIGDQANAKLEQVSQQLGTQKLR